MEPERASHPLVKSLAKPIAELGLEPAHGVRGNRAYRRLVGRLQKLLFGRRVDTEGIGIEPDHFHPDRVTYGPSDWRMVRRVLRRLDITPEDVLVDFGSGKGRVVYEAAKLPFKRVVGVEIVERLNRVAEENIERNRHRLACPDVELVTEDATAFTVPDDMTVAYLYYPFVGETFRVVIENIVASLDRAPRRVRIVYACPKLGDVILGTGRFRLEDVLPGGRDNEVLTRVEIYASVDAGGASAP